MRCEPTEPDKRLWRRLSNSQLGGWKFRRQAVIGRRIVDFFYPAIGPVIEVYGDTHDFARDREKDRAFEVHGLCVLRFTNADVTHNMEGVLEAILLKARSLPSRSSWRLPHPNPSPEGEGR
ncbi:endonuclease domain-containing protein [Sphingomonas colocasiae]|nr:endonuclease domain-containing protein [Sphingomonas colocasiae]